MKAIVVGSECNYLKKNTTCCKSVFPNIYNFTKILFIGHNFPIAN